MELVHREDIDRVRQANVIANLQVFYSNEFTNMKFT